MKIQRGVMLVKEGKGWGILYEDGRSTSYGWIGLEDAIMYSEGGAFEVRDLYRQELHGARVVKAERRTEVVFTKETHD